LDLPNPPTLEQLRSKDSKVERRSNNGVRSKMVEPVENEEEVDEEGEDEEEDEDDEDDEEMESLPSSHEGTDVEPELEGLGFDSGGALGSCDGVPRLGSSHREHARQQMESDESSRNTETDRRYSLTLDPNRSNQPVFEAHFEEPSKDTSLTLAAPALSSGLGAISSRSLLRPSTANAGTAVGWARPSAREKSVGEDGAEYKVGTLMSGTVAGNVPHRMQSGTAGRRARVMGSVYDNVVMDCEKRTRPKSSLERGVDCEKRTRPKSSLERGVLQGKQYFQVRRDSLDGEAFLGGGPLGAMEEPDQQVSHSIPVRLVPGTDVGGVSGGSLLVGMKKNEDRGPAEAIGGGVKGLGGGTAHAQSGILEAFDLASRFTGIASQRRRRSMWLVSPVSVESCHLLPDHPALYASSLTTSLLLSRALDHHIAQGQILAQEELHEPERALEPKTDGPGERIELNEASSSRPMLDESRPSQNVGGDLKKGPNPLDYKKWQRMHPRPSSTLGFFQPRQGPGHKSSSIIPPRAQSFVIGRRRETLVAPHPGASGVSGIGAQPLLGNSVLSRGNLANVGDGSRPQTAPTSEVPAVLRSSSSSLGSRELSRKTGAGIAMAGMVASKGRSPMVVGLRRDEVSDRASEVIKAMSHNNMLGPRRSTRRPNR